MAAAHGEVVLRQRPCLGCQALFLICEHCDRGHRYCSLECRHQARLQQRRRANRRHQQSPEGRLDHRDRQRQYRERCGQARVTDQGSLSIVCPALSTCGEKNRSGGGLLPRWPESQSWGLWLRCRICGRVGRLVDSFPRIFRKR
jgi:hypothetical protein